MCMCTCIEHAIVAEVIYVKCRGTNHGGLFDYSDLSNIGR